MDNGARENREANDFRASRRHHEGAEISRRNLAILLARLAVYGGASSGEIRSVFRDSKVLKLTQDHMTVMSRGFRSIGDPK